MKVRISASGLARVKVLSSAATLLAVWVVLGEGALWLPGTELAFSVVVWALVLHCWSWARPLGAVLLFAAMVWFWLLFIPWLGAVGFEFILVCALMVNAGILTAWLGVLLTRQEGELNR